MNLKYIVLLWACLGLLAQAEVTTYPAPRDEELSQDYQIEADGQTVDVYLQPVRVNEPTEIYGQPVDYGGPYSFAYFDFSGTVSVRITTDKDLSGLTIRPDSYGIQYTVEGNTITFTLNQPRKLAIEPEGKHGPLFLFANPMEIDPPQEGDPNVIYYGPGIHNPERIDVGSNQTLYLAGGAVVKGAIVPEGNNIRILGRGILCGNNWAHMRGPTRNMMEMTGNDIEIEGIILRGSWMHTIRILNSSNVTVRNVKICGGRCQNDDGIQPASSQGVLIEDVFIRSDDDCIAIKGYDRNTYVEDITIRNSSFWCDRARIILMGHETLSQGMRNILVENIDVLHYVIDVFLLEPGEDVTLEDVIIQNVRIHADGDPWHTQNFITLGPTVNQYMQVRIPGRINNVELRNIALTGNENDTYGVWVRGEDSQHMVENVTFENVTRFGELVTQDSRNVNVEGEYTRNIRFIEGNTGISLRPVRHHGPWEMLNLYNILGRKMSGVMSNLKSPQNVMTSTRHPN